MWIEYGRWDREDWSQEGIDKKICDILTDLNRDAGLGIIRGSHKDRKSMYGDLVKMHKERGTHFWHAEQMFEHIEMRDRFHNITFDLFVIC